jgi:hypothetical protein
MAKPGKRLAGGREIAERHASGWSAAPPPVEPWPKPGDDPSMEARVICDDLTMIIGRLSAVEGKLDILVTQVVSKVPSGLQMFGIIVGTLVAGVAIFGGALGVAQWPKLVPR